MQGVAETLIMTGYKLVVLTAGLLPVVVVLPRPSSFQTEKGRGFMRWEMLQAAVNAPFRPSCGRNYLADTTGRKGQGLWLRTDKSCSLLEDRRGITMYWLSCTLDVGGHGGMQVPGWMHLWCDLRCLFFCCEQLYFSEVSFLGSAETEIMLLRTYSCSSRTAKTKLFFKARSAAALQNRCMEF